MKASELWHAINDLGAAPSEIVKYALSDMKTAEWRSKKGEDTDYWVADFRKTLPINGFRRAFFIKLKPGGRLHEHSDGYDGRTYHIPIKTNKDCKISFRTKSGSIDEKITEHRMEAKRIYEIDRTIPHWSENGGKTDRVHLVVESTV